MQQQQQQWTRLSQHTPPTRKIHYKSWPAVHLPERMNCSSPAETMQICHNQLCLVCSSSIEIRCCWPVKLHYDRCLMDHLVSRQTNETANKFSLVSTNVIGRASDEAKNARARAASIHFPRALMDANGVGQYGSRPVSEASRCCFDNQRRRLSLLFSVNQTKSSLSPSDLGAAAAAASCPNSTQVASNSSISQRTKISLEQNRSSLVKANQIRTNHLVKFDQINREQATNLEICTSDSDKASCSKRSKKNLASIIERDFARLPTSEAGSF